MLCLEREMKEPLGSRPQMECEQQTCLTTNPDIVDPKQIGLVEYHNLPPIINKRIYQYNKHLFSYTTSGDPVAVQANAYVLPTCVEISAKTGCKYGKKRYIYIWTQNARADTH